MDEKEELEKKLRRLGDMQKELGNEFRNKGQFDEAIRLYTGAIENHTAYDAEVYCNRALCYASVGALAEGLKDADKCLELDPTFTKGYLQKGHIEYEMEQHSKALETYEMGLQHDKQNKELHEAISKCRKQMPPAVDQSIAVQSREGLNEAQAKALLDPEIQVILHDPIMRQIIFDFQLHSSKAREHVKNKLVVQKLKKLLDAGLL